MRLAKLAAPVFVSALSAAWAFAALAKLPPPSDEAKAKAAEAAAKTAWTDKVASFQLCKAMNKAAANYQATAKQLGKTPATPVETPACADPGPYVAPAAASAPPIEAAGAHSPPKTANAPPSTTAPAATAPKK
ncbi:MAG TPA: hypothetical protein VIO33_25990 [Burkholderiaceae bacterium]